MNPAPGRRRGAQRRAPRGGAAEFELPLRVTLVRPPAGVRLCVQGKDAADLVGATTATGGDVTFDVSVRVRPGGGVADAPRFLGRFAHGPSGKRFLYVCSGTSAGQADSRWTRRAKVALWTIPPDLIEKVRAGTAARLQGLVQGTAGDGGPACASVPLLDDGWRAVVE